MRRKLAAGVLLLGLASPCLTGAAEPDLFAGGSYVRTGGGDVGPDTSEDLYGWHVSLSYRFLRALRWVVELAGHYGSLDGVDLSWLTFMSGPRLAFGSGQLRPFVHALVGGVRESASVKVLDVSISESDTDWGVAVGGGVDYRLSGRWGLRLQGDALIVRADGQTETDPRLSVGAVYRFGR